MAIYLMAILCSVFIAEVFIFLEFQTAPETPIYADFRHFYTAAKMVATGAASQLYNIDAQTAFQHEIIYPYKSEVGILPYNHPPFQIIAYIPLIILPLKWAYRVWIIVSLGLIAISLSTLGSYFRPASRNGQLIMWLVCLSFFPTFATLLLGQDSAISLLIFTLTFYYIKKGKEGSAGAILALGLFKPQLVGITAIIFLFKRRWKALGCFCLVGLLLISLSIFMVGWQGVIEYLRLIIKSATWENQYGIFPSKMYNLKAFFYLIFGFDQMEFLIPALGFTMIGFLTLLFFVWRGKWEPSAYLFDLKFSLLIMVTLLVNPHLYAHDLILWIIPGILLVNYLNRENPKIKGYMLEALLPIGYMSIILSSLYSISLNLKIGVIFTIVAVALLAYEIILFKRSQGGYNDGKELS
ncbi:MAG: glycosyltransferase family 87 protein [Pseudomonadota bacterium]